MPKSSPSMSGSTSTTSRFKSPAFAALDAGTWRDLDAQIDERFDRLVKFRRRLHASWWRRERIRRRLDASWRCGEWIRARLSASW